MLQLETEQVWKEIGQNVFAVLGMVTPNGEARTAGIVYCVAGRKFYIASMKYAWKVKHIRQNPCVSLTIPIAKGIPLMPWFKIPAATITLSGRASLLENRDVQPAVLAVLYRGVVKDDQMMAESCVIELAPQGDFLTYGVGIPLMQMRHPDRAAGRAAVA